MIPKRQLILAAALGLAAAALLAIGELRSGAQGRASYSVQPNFTDEGRQMVPMATIVYTDSWTLVVSSDAVRRHLHLQWLAGNNSQLCLSTTTKTGDLCNDSTPGVTLSSVTPTFDSYGHGAWYGRVYASSGDTQKIKGYYARDSADFGYNIQGDPLQ